MNKKYLFRTALCALVAIASACSSDEFVEEPTNNNQIVMSATDFEYEKEARTSIDITTDGGEFNWAENDTVGIFPNEGSQVAFPMINGAGTKTANFNGGGWALKPSSTYAAYYPYYILNTDKTKIPINYTGQVQEGNASTAHLGQFDYMAAKMTTPQKGIVTFNFKHLGALIELNLKSELSAIDELTIIADKPVLSQKGFVDLSTSEMAFVSGEKSNNLNISLKNINHADDLKHLKVYFMMAPVDLSSTKITLKATNNEGAFELFNLPSKKFESGKAYTLLATKTDPLPKKDPMILVARANISNSFTVTLPISPTYGEKMSCTVDWGDGHTESYEREIISEMPVSHVYNISEPMSFDIKITGNVPCLTKIEAAQSIMEVKQWGNTGLKQLSKAFENNGILQKLAPDVNGSFKDVTSFYNTFANCVNLKDIPEGLFDYVQNASFHHTFDGCIGLTSLPNKLFSKCSKATNFTGTFANCFGLQSIPDYLFANCSQVIDFNETFSNCVGITEIPSHLFANCSSASEFYRTFYECNKLSILPSYLFKDCFKASSFDDTFKNCKSLTTLPEHLFTGCTGNVSFFRTFANCPISYIPGNLFEGCVNATSFNLVFWTCETLKSIPANLFADCVNATQFGSTFAACSALEKIPDALFKNCLKVKYFLGTFQECKSLSSVPSGLFDSCTEVTSMEKTFELCSSLSSIPVDLFDNNRKIDRFDDTFSGCVLLTGESPYTIIKSVKYHLYERYKNKDFFVTPTYTERCFDGCKKLTDFNQIPYNWGGEIMW